MRFSTMPDSEIISELCRRIKETRIQLGLSQIELAERAQVGAATIKRVELGKVRISHMAREHLLVTH